jgi:dCMP deaminase
MNTAIQFSTLSYAQRKKVGALLADENGRILVTAYNGSISGSENVCEESTDIECPDCTAGHIIKNDEIHTCPNCDHNGKVLKTKDSTLHAEENLICYAAKHGISVNNTIIFITTSPCLPCARKLVQSGIKEVYYNEEYRNLDGVEFLRQYIKCEQYPTKI